MCTLTYFLKLLNGERRCEISPDALTHSTVTTLHDVQIERYRFYQKALLYTKCVHNTILIKHCNFYLKYVSLWYVFNETITFTAVLFSLRSMKLKSRGMCEGTGIFSFANQQLSPDQTHNRSNMAISDSVSHV